MAMRPPVHHTEPTQKRVRAELDGVTVLDSTDVLLAWEWPHYPTYYLPRRDVDAGVVALARPQNENYPDHVRFDWTTFDRWFEEDEEVFVHPRDPYSRIDIIASSRKVEILVDGVELAESTDALFLYETRLPRRTYLPPQDVDLELAAASGTRTRCPYKGIASYWSFEVNGHLHEDLAWFYPDPVWQAGPIIDRICFFDERVTTLVDGVEEQQPSSIFSSEVDPQP